MRRVRGAALAVSTLLISGCLFTGGVRESDITQLETQIQSINQRIDQLEASRAGGSSAASFGASAVGSSTFESATSAGAGAARGARWPGLAFSWMGATNKLVRGLTNVITGWVEVPKRVQETTEQSGALPGFTWGLLRGFGRGFIRTAAGAYETVTFPFPAPPEYRPVMRPVYVFTCETDDTTTRSP